MPLLFQSFPNAPLWAAIVFASFSVISGILNVIQLYKSKETVQWKSAAESARSAATSAESERNNLRDVRDRLIEQNKELTSQNAVLAAKTDLNGLKGEMLKAMAKIQDDFKLHSEQDLSTANQTIASLNAVQETMKLLQERAKSGG